MFRHRESIHRGAVAVSILAVLAGTLAVGIVGGSAVALGDDDSSRSDSSAVGVSEEAYAEPVPEPGDRYYEAAADDGSWISYINPRDEYRSPYLGDGSGKICVTLLNEAGEPIVGETVPETTVTVPTGKNLEWHSQADPVRVEYPLTDHYDRPLDADQFGTNPDLPQGDGYLDTHCIEMHGHPEDATIEYGEAEIDGAHADRIELIGYVQQQPGGDGWDTSIDPIDDAVSYEEAGGNWTYQTDASHGQVVVVLQLTEGESDNSDDSGSDTDTAPSDGDPSAPNVPDEVEDDTGEDGTGGTNDTDDIPGFGVVATVFALAVLVAVRGRR